MLIRYISVFMMFAFGIFQSLCVVDWVQPCLSNITVSGYIRAEYTRVGLYSGRVYSIRVNSGRFEAGRNRIGFRTDRVLVGFGLSIFGSLRVGFTSSWVISGVGQFRISFGYRLVYVGCSGPNRFTPFRVSVRVWTRVNRFRFRVSCQFCQV